MHRLFQSLVSGRARLLAAAGVLVLLSGSVRTMAEDAVQHPQPPAQAAPADQPSGAAGCPYAEKGACCGDCQEKAQQGKTAEEAHADCPCKRAKQSQQGS